MKTFLGAWFGTLVIGWLLLNLFGSLLGSTGLLLAGVTVIAILISGLASLATELDGLRKRVEKLERPQKMDDTDSTA